MTTEQQTTKPEKKANHYVHNDVLLPIIIDFRKRRDQAIAEGKPEPPMPNEIGKAILDIANGLAKRFNFRDYSYIDEMIGAGIRDCIGGVYSFNYEKYDKPYSYFNRICWWAFVGVIKEEKQEHAERTKLMLDPTVVGFDTLDADSDMNISRQELQDFFYNGK